MLKKLVLKHEQTNINTICAFSTDLLSRPNYSWTGYRQNKHRH